MQLTVEIINICDEEGLLHEESVTVLNWCDVHRNYVVSTLDICEDEVPAPNIYV